MKWYNSYTGFPYKHLGDDIKTGIDCFNLCRLVYKEKLNITQKFGKNEWVTPQTEFEKIFVVELIISKLLEARNLKVNTRIDLLQ